MARTEKPKKVAALSLSKKVEEKEEKGVKEKEDKGHNIRDIFGLEKKKVGGGCIDLLEDSSSDKSLVSVSGAKPAASSTVPPTSVAAACSTAIGSTELRAHPHPPPNNPQKNLLLCRLGVESTSLLSKSG